VSREIGKRASSHHLKIVTKEIHILLKAVLPTNPCGRVPISDGFVLLFVQIYSLQEDHCTNSCCSGCLPPFN
jgi:hypothetical protein